MLQFATVLPAHFIVIFLFKSASEFWQSATNVWSYGAFFLLWSGPPKYLWWTK